MEREEAKRAFKKIAASYPRWEITHEIVETWIEELEASDPEHVWANLKEHIREKHYPPSIFEIVKPNQRIEADREKERTRKLIDEQTARENRAPVDPPWKREGISREEWMRKVIAEGKGS